MQCPLLHRLSLSFIRHKTDSLTLTYTPSSISRFNRFLFSLNVSTKKSNVKEKTVDDSDRNVIFDDLVPGRLYEICGKQIQKIYTFYYVQIHSRNFYCLFS